MKLSMANWMDKDEVAGYLDVHPMHVWRLVRRGDLPSPVYLTGKQGLWPRDVVQAYVEKKINQAELAVKGWKEKK